MGGLSIMSWNWQKADWPHFSWNKAQLAPLEERFLMETGVFVGTTKHLGGRDLEEITIEAMSTEGVTTSEIEGEFLDRASVQSSIRKQIGLSVDKRRARPAEEGVAEMMVDLYRGFAAPLSDEMLFGWRRMLLGKAGGYRTGPEAMQVVSGAIHARKVHFEAPPSTAMVREMERFVDWFNGERLPAVTKAGVAHLYFVSIHPFEDGNGRIARAIAQKAWGRTVLLSATILARRKAYYAALEAASKGNEITGWLSWFAETAIEAQRRTIARVEFVIEKTRLLDRLRGQINERQEKALLRMVRRGAGALECGLSASNYSSITGASPATTTRDLADLVGKGGAGEGGGAASRAVSCGDCEAAGMSDEFTYDVFLSYSSKDKAVVGQVAERLRGDGLRVWFDAWVLKAGDHVQIQD